MKRFLSYCLIGYFFISLLSAQETTFTYEMTALGADIGTVSTTRNTVGDDTYYHSKSLFEVNLLFKKIRMEIDNYAHYHAGKLMKVTNHVTVNGETRNSSKIIWQDGKYAIEIDGESKPSLSSPILYSGTILYHKEPIGIQKAFSESSGIYMPVKLLAKGKYQITDPNNNRKMIHYYEDGVQTKVEIKHPLLTLSMTLTDQKKSR